MKVTFKIIIFTTLLLSLLLPISAQNDSKESVSGTAVTDFINLSIAFTENFYESAYLNKDFECSIPVINEDYEKIIYSKFEYVKAPRISTPCNSFSIKFKEAKFIETDEYVYVCLPITAQYYTLGNSSFSNLEFFRFKKAEGSYILENWCTSSDIIDFDFYLFKIEQFAFLNIEEYVSWLDNSINYSDYTEKAAETSSSRKEYFQKEKITAQGITLNKTTLNTSIQNSAKEKAIAYSTYNRLFIKSIYAVLKLPL